MRQVVRPLEVLAVLDAETDLEFDDDAGEKRGNVVEIILVVSHQDVALHEIVRGDGHLLYLHVTDNERRNILPNTVANHHQLGDVTIRVVVKNDYT